MLYVYDQRFDVMENLEIFCEMNKVLEKWLKNPASDDGAVQ